MTYTGGVPVAEVVRSGFIEGRHHGSVAVLDAEGSLVASAGDPYGPIFPRSSNKPMQAVAMLRSGLRLADPADLAMVCASHSGEPFHIDRIRVMLRRGGLDESQLRCPPDLPLSESAQVAVLAAGGGRERILMNCSGKHAGMLLTCRAAGWPVEGYTAADHPLQKACRTAVEELADAVVAATGVDGCGAPVMALPLVGLARAFLRLVAAAQGTVERAVADAMRANPVLVSGTGREDAMLMSGIPGLLAKVGAEGVHAVALAGAGAVAVKIDDGAARARQPVLAAALRRLGISAPVLDDLAEVPVLGGGVQVGSVRCAPSSFPSLPPSLPPSPPI
jgi:L-asparaginase II